MELLDRKTLGEVIAASPVLEEGPLEQARRVVVVLEGVDESVEVKNGDAFTARVQEIAEGAELSAKRAGQILRALGITIGGRQNDGYHAYWVYEQIAILKNALGV